ncbi:ovarian cancer G-protein coupled receptor 1-like [Amblyraja radiata]|uniref:ovarian cancer G-protein coupled receptor 1-like n=1 Tax=Amblyraja radiata TaxID=386614 RepID=UPI001403ED94|nr:ovarian cancer G-protein coupled receptor 1-like [Amblyraja radiata]
MDNVTVGRSNSSCLVDNSASVLVPVIYAATFLVSLPGNCLSIYVAALQVKRGNEIGVYLINLSSVDIIYTLTLPYWFCHHFTTAIGNVSVHNAVVVVSSSTMFMSPAFLCCIAADRHLAIVHPLRFHRLRTLWAAAAMSAMCWLLQLSLHALLLHRQGLLSSDFASRPLWEDLPLEATTAEVYLIRFLLSFCLPFSLFIFCSQRIYRAVARSSSVEDGEKRKIAKLLLLLLLVYAVSFGPYQLTALARGVAEPGNCPFAQLAITPYNVFFAWTGVNCAADPIVYCWLSDTAQQDIVHLTTALKHKLPRLCRRPEHHRADRTPKQISDLPL